MVDSPVIYQQDEETITAFKAMSQCGFLRCVRAGITIRWRRKLPRIFAGRRSSTEKILLRAGPLLAVRWVEAGKGVPPMRFLSYWREANLMRRYVQK